MRIDSATPPSGFAQNDSIAGGLENSNGNERRIQCFTCGANSTQLGLHFYALHEDGVKGRFSVISHHIERLDTWLAHVAIIYLENCLQLLPPKNLFSSIPECRSARRAFMPEVAESNTDANGFSSSILRPINLSHAELLGRNHLQPPPFHFSSLSLPTSGRTCSSW